MCERECGERQHWRERKKRRERTKERRRERERRMRKRERARECFLFSIHISFFSAQGTLHFISVFGHTVMVWQHSSLPLLSLSQSFSFSRFLFNSHTQSHALSLFSHSLFSLSLRSRFIPEDIAINLLKRASVEEYSPIHMAVLNRDHTHIMGHAKYVKKGERERKR